MAHTVLLTACHKGGTTKSTTTVNFAYSWAAMTDCNVLVIDLDPQANATYNLGVNNADPRLAADLLAGGKPVGECAMRLADHVNWDPTPVPDNLYLVPATIELTALKSELTATPDGMWLLGEALADLDNNWLVIIDTGPDHSPLSNAAVLAATDIVVPVTPSLADYQGGTKMWTTLSRTVDKFNINMAGMLVAKVDGRDRSAVVAAVLNQTRKLDLPGGAFDTCVRTSTRVNESYGNQMPVGAYEPDSPGAVDLAAAATEFLQQRSAAALRRQGAPAPVTMRRTTLPAVDTA